MSKQKNKKHSTTKHTHKALLETGVLERPSIPSAPTI